MGGVSRRRHSHHPRRDAVLKRLPFFACGATCHLICLAAFLNAMVFVASFSVPTRHHDDPQGLFAAALGN